MCSSRCFSTVQNLLHCLMDLTMQIFGSAKFQLVVAWTVARSDSREIEKCLKHCANPFGRVLGLTSWCQTTAARMPTCLNLAREDSRLRRCQVRIATSGVSRGGKCSALLWRLQRDGSSRDPILWCGEHRSTPRLCVDATWKMLSMTTKTINVRFPK